MALRVKSEPIVILDPQEQMLLDLKNTIAELRSENKRMAEALSGLSQGLSAEEVLRSLMDPNIPPVRPSLNVVHFALGAKDAERVDELNGWYQG
jgi:hypothetical protein